MLIIHQRKSAGTSLVHTLEGILGTGIDTDKTISIFNSRGKKLHDYLAGFVSADTAIKSVHLHPTRENFSWIADNQIRCVILLRKPQDAHEAMFRHAEPDGGHKRINGAARYPRAGEILKEFYNNWSLLRDREHTLTLYFEDVVNRPAESIQRILDFYGIDKDVSGIELEKKRLSSRKREAQAEHDHSILDANAPTFLYDPDYRTLARKLRRRLDRLLKGPKQV